MQNSIIFISSDDYSPKRSIRKLFSVSLCDLCFRIYASFIPPLTKRFQKIYLDLLGPLVAYLLLILILHYGHYNKDEMIDFSPINFLISYVIIMPLLCKLLLNCSSSNISYYEILCLIGYALYGHVLSLSVSLVFFDETSNRFFFLCTVIFCGLSTFRLAIILLKSIPKPAMRLLVCSVVCIIQILSLIFVHFAYMHKTYTYNRQTLQT